MADNPIPFPTFIPKVIDFPNASYELVRPIKGLAECHDGTPLESRTVYTARLSSTPTSNACTETFIIKIKVQVPEKSDPTPTQPATGPSTTTTAELHALETFRKANVPDVPHLVDFKNEVQESDAPLPGGYITYTVMTLLPGDTLYKLGYWTMESEEREAVVRGFLPVVRSIHALGIEPIDRGLRNVLWNRETQKCIIDFELWRETDKPIPDETTELQRWALIEAPPVKGWFDAWARQWR